MRILLVAALACVSAAPAFGQTPDAIDRAASAWAKVRTMRGTFEQTVTNALTGGSARARGEYAQERPNRLSIRFTDPSGDAIVSDGRVLWLYLPSATPGQVVKRPATDRASMPVDLTGQFLDNPRAKYTIVAAGTRTVDGHPTHAFTLTPKPGRQAGFEKATVWIDDDDSIIREFEETESSGVTRHIHLTRVELNVPVDASRFTFSLPAGVKVVDQTKE